MSSRDYSRNIWLRSPYGRIIELRHVYSDQYGTERSHHWVAIAYVANQRDHRMAMEFIEKAAGQMWPGTVMSVSVNGEEIRRVRVTTGGGLMQIGEATTDGSDLSDSELSGGEYLDA